VKFWILLDFVVDFEDWEDGGFLSWCVDESAIWFTAFPAYLISFNYPRLGKNNG
jgi:hypothetical protein